jgi:flavin reductase (DIM6/NTAB) family NADH-FMN oxidoreductase RutF
VNKVKECGLTPVPSREVQAPGFDEAELILECRKIYYSDFDPAHFLADFIEPNYPEKDYHRMYFGWIVSAWGTAQYRMKE